ncbi:cytochrome P450, putative [Pediculus humanus corporis]|uniref:Cytochrome P450, putative n=1 Tax=Pediculus humanus subsp. corporis TaxID=121224 RepID=E0VSD4_PEDHC|nr:cytochrome P450, putative [Pediculus humanus corporis]EEB16290.1 cytochrome P450, putative [Pediculus humanus corporis]
MDWIQVLMLATTFIYLLYKLTTKNYNYWLKKGLKQTNPYPIVGDNGPMIFKTEDPLTNIKNLYDRFKEKMSGMYIFMQPSLFIRDPEILKLVMIKDAEYFINRFNWIKNTDPLLSKSLNLLQDEEWKTLRSVMTTVFTGAKMKDMFKFMDKCARQSVQHLEKQIRNRSGKGKPEGNDSNVLELELKEFFSRYGTDVIASTAFGLELNSFEDPNNQFFNIGTVIRKIFTSFPIFKMIFMLNFPKLTKALNITFFGDEINNFFYNIVDENIKNREEHNIVRKDVIHILMEARKSKNVNGNKDEEYGRGKIPSLTNAGITAQAVFFFFGGFDITATVLGFMCYELAINPDVQQQLHEEITQIMTETGNDDITYDDIMFKMSYLDMVVKETLRKWPPAVMTDREVSKTYVMPKTENTPEFTLVRGDIIFIPIIAIHHDPKYYPEPEKFDPERFRDEKNTINPLTYLPFGAGLRHCIALRYAMMEVKIGLVRLVSKFQVLPTEKTKIPIKLKKDSGFLLSPENGFQLKLKLRAP